MVEWLSTMAITYSLVRGSSGEELSQRKHSALYESLVPSALCLHVALNRMLFVTMFEC